MDTTMAETQSESFPIGFTVDQGGYIVSERLFGERARGIYRGVNAWDFQRTMLITVTTEQERPLDQLMSELAREVKGIARLRHIGEVEPVRPGAGRYDAMVEEEPPGQPLSQLQWPLSPAEVIGLGRQIAEVLERAHQRGFALGGLHPELIYLDERMGLTGIVSRPLQFAATARPPSYGLRPLFRASYDPPELLSAGKREPAGDVFSLSALMAHLVSGQHPYQGERRVSQVISILQGGRREFAGPARWRPLLDRGLAADAAERPPAAELVAAIEVLR
jgi:serine/threonine protein kinase